MNVDFTAKTEFILTREFVDRETKIYRLNLNN